MSSRNFQPRTPGPRVPMRFEGGVLDGVTGLLRCDGDVGPPYESMPSEHGHYEYDGSEVAPEHTEVWIWKPTT